MATKKKAKKRLKSTSKGGQSLAARAKESKGKKKANLKRLSKVDKANYAKAPEEIQEKIKASYKRGKKSKARIKNKGKLI
ncbi:MAG: hypothetical protein JKY14_13755 [Paraglaciecola sp.]|nr:hypothetical protein [Paraglaciecola sp.]